jgi:hypothetical protein
MKQLHYLGFVVSDLFFWKHPHILWYGARFNQCLIFRQKRLGGGKMRCILVAGDFINRLIHRSWGRGFCEYFP